MAPRTQWQQDIGHLKGLMEGMGKTVQRIEKALDGNGHPGLIRQTGDTRQDLDALVQAVAELGAMMKAQAESIGTLRLSLETHQKDKDLHSLRMWLSWRGVMLFLGSAVAANAIIPPDFSLWDWLRTWVRL